MRTNEAFKILGLRPDATPSEVKEAYRDLVKVWHPDRFGSDPRLRLKAEEKLREINDAYRLLQLGSVSNGGAAAETEKTAGASGRDAPFAYDMPAAPMAPTRRAKRNNARILGWVFGCAGIVLGLMAGYILRERGSMEKSRETAALSQKAEKGDPAHAAGLENVTPGMDVAGQKTGPARQLDRNAAPKDAGSSNRSGAAQYQVFSLSDAQTSQLELACLSQRELHGEAAYQACVQAQLNSIANASNPDLNALSVAERESIESVCSGARRHGGTNSYNHCLNIQLAQLAAEPLRPDLSTLSERDRNSIEAACRSTKYREGPSAYDRCLMRFIKLLAESK